MQPLEDADISIFRTVRFVLTDMDETLTYNGRLSSETYAALEQLQTAGVKVIPVTAAPAGWCDQMARMWPIDGVIGENGGLFFRRASQGHGVERYFWHEEQRRLSIERELSDIGQNIKQVLPFATFADDQPFRQTSLAFSQPHDPAERDAILAALKAASLNITVNNLWVLGWIGEYDKLSMSRRILLEHYDLDISTDPDAVLYTGDSTNDAPMFAFFRHSVGVSTVSRFLDQIPQPPNWITVGPGGRGFVEAARVVMAARQRDAGS
ncbi:HAD-IIB family hydrolase [Brytella acorum]|uniref:HAD-IIB family hydrolase n=2 Tax=Acetobacteraceae TaxID=433 RepID=A0AA35UN02_9PROT|nr:HAD-IIB family hydrolase [Brytella acorum]MDF3623331.1 HAD-IIB family hydrolase [Brytella acorum]CAI9120408.1 HAD-IIB family hydrolase [Brytella acorum]